MSEQTRILRSSLVQTCEASPSQWDARTEDGEFVYIRYRWGGLTISTGESKKDAVLGKCILDFDMASTRSSWDGVLTTEEMIDAAHSVKRAGVLFV